MDLPAIEWYRDEDLILGCCGPFGGLGIYRHRIGGGGGWEFCPPETRAWDGHHQWIYLQGRAVRCELPSGVPPLPASFPPSRDSWIADPPERLSPSAEPGSPVFERVRSAPGCRLRVFVVLREDAYESAFGDGIFRYFDSAHLDRAAAESRIAARKASDDDSRPSAQLPYRYHLREADLVITDGRVRIDASTSERSPFDHFTAGEVCDDLGKGALSPRRPPASGR